MNFQEKDDMSFVAIDFETANSDYSSICQIGIVHFEKGEIVSKMSYLVDPQTNFDPVNIGIHKIKPQDVVGKPTFIEIYSELIEKINNRIVVHHRKFDYIALEKACAKLNLEMPNSSWVDTSIVVRSTWEQFQVKGYGLKEVANYLNIEFDHHDACEDARIAGLILIEASINKGKYIENRQEPIKSKRVRMPGIYDNHTRISGDILKPTINTEDLIGNPFYKKKVVISGTYNLWPDRNDLGRIIKGLGGDVDTSVTDRTNILCSGEETGWRKMEKMQSNIESGRDAIIINEAEIIIILRQCNISIPDLN